MRPEHEHELDRLAADILTKGDMKREDPARAALERLSPPYEIRVRAERDPIVEATLKYREMAEEVTDRYDAYLSRVRPPSPSRPEV
jgi:predicted transcriptional regulator